MLKQHYRMPNAKLPELKIFLPPPNHEGRAGGGGGGLNIFWYFTKLKMPSIIPS